MGPRVDQALAVGVMLKPQGGGSIAGTSVSIISSHFGRLQLGGSCQVGAPRAFHSFCMALSPSLIPSANTWCRWVPGSADPPPPGLPRVSCHGPTSSSWSPRMSLRSQPSAAVPNCSSPNFWFCASGSTWCGGRLGQRPRLCGWDSPHEKPKSLSFPKYTPHKINSFKKNKGVDKKMTGYAAVACKLDSHLLVCYRRPEGIGPVVPRYP